jgi:hypothetical protein
MTYQLKQTWSKYKHGEAVENAADIGDLELCLFIDDLQLLVEKLQDLGETFQFSWREVNTVLVECEEFARARDFVELNGKWFPSTRKMEAALGPECEFDDDLIDQVLLGLQDHMWN